MGGAKVAIYTKISSTYLLLMTSDVQSFTSTGLIDSQSALVHELTTSSRQVDRREAGDRATEKYTGLLQSNEASGKASRPERKDYHIGAALILSNNMTVKMTHSFILY